MKSEVKTHEQNVQYGVLQWGPCIVHLRISESFHEKLLTEAKESRKPTQDYRKRLAGIIKEEYSFRDREMFLPEISQCLTIPEFKLEITGLPVKKNNFITFGCFNQFAKINNDEVISLWSKILLSIKNSKLFLKTQELSNNKFSEEILNRFKKFNVNTGRIVLEG